MSATPAPEALLSPELVASQTAFWRTPGNRARDMAAMPSMHLLKEIKERVIRASKSGASLCTFPVKAVDWESKISEEALARGGYAVSWVRSSENPERLFVTLDWEN